MILSIRKEIKFTFIIKSEEGFNMRFHLFCAISFIIIFTANNSFTTPQIEDTLKADVIYGGALIRINDLEFPQSERNDYLSPYNQYILSTRISIELREGTIRDVLKLISAKAESF